ncbi:hypothetical protein F2Q68_00011426 [Brassica cretica]|uniref:Uncharacterized protein n=1 Tax=Brassica cretica TaxID=69181 RepID=A0A8S9KWN1_BRACR|nr:hypothetical protein F2Q68_00011426 [Brassica cretica]
MICRCHFQNSKLLEVTLTVSSMAETDPMVITDLPQTDSSLDEEANNSQSLAFQRIHLGSKIRQTEVEKSAAKNSFTDEMAARSDDSNSS